MSTAENTDIPSTKSGYTDAQIERMWKKRNLRNWIALFLIGTFNNISYVVVNTSAQAICKAFDKENLVGLIVWFNAGFSFIIRLLHSFFMLKIPFTIRLAICLICYLLGLIGVALSVKIHISVAFISIVVVGCTYSLGESIIMGYMRNFPADSVGGFSSGTGFAGVAGAGLVFLLNALNVPIMIMFLSLTPLCVIYFLVYLFFLKPPKDLPPRPSTEAPVHEDVAEKQVVQGDSKDAEGVNPLMNEGEDERTDETAPLIARRETGCQRFNRVHKSIFWLSFQLMLVYFFEYVVQVGAAHCAFPKKVREESTNFWIKNAFTCINLCYQIGVVISRSSLGCIKIKRVWIMTLLQGLNFVLWMFVAGFQFVKGYWIFALFAHTIFVGLMGGGMYVNTFYLIMQKKDATGDDKELASNMTMIYITIGITLASLFSLLMTEVFFKKLI
ncbi:putative CLN3 protein [Blattamonas nauphoetae]|uniref:CLN3 protein n=1 Tax=Blattamonas nauphoetae TaxID=2049346 RepID=A0ABQ9WZ22_9EUKA|nr:putative CLN3 protein [Blattamonas nauphoetae]